MIRQARISFPAARSGGNGEVQLDEPGIFTEPAAASCRGFLNRVLELENLREISIDPVRGRAILFHSVEQASGTFLRRLAVALGQPNPSHASAAESLCLRRSRPSSVSIFRYEAGISTWKIVHSLPGRVRLRHDEIWRKYEAAQHIENELRAVHGVTQASANSHTGTLLVSYDESALTLRQLLYVVEGLLKDLTDLQSGSIANHNRAVLVDNSNLGLSLMADFVSPMVAPLSAGVLVWSNLRKFGEAARELRQLRPGPATVYSAIAGLTLASGMFFPAALMASLVNFWDRLYHRRVATAQNHLLTRIRRQAHFASVCRDDRHWEVPIDAVQPGDVLAVRSGGLIPVDGVVSSGRARVDERLVRGAVDHAWKEPGDQVYANSLVFEGELSVRVESVGVQTRAHAIATVVHAATTPAKASLSSRGEPFSRNLSAPTLATAGLGLLVGDINTALAVLRPDYATGPGMIAPLGTLEDITRGLDRGIVIRNVDVFARIGTIDTVLIDLGENLRPDPQFLNILAKALVQLRSDGKLQIGLISDRTPVRTNDLADRLGVDFVRNCSSSLDRGAVIDECQQEGGRVAYIGDCRRNDLAARQASVAISLGDVVCQAEDPADAFLLRRDLSALAGLWDISRQYTLRRRAVYTRTLIPNLCSVVGAFTLGFTGLHAVLLTNLGVFTVYRGASRWLRDAQIARW